MDKLSAQSAQRTSHPLPDDLDVWQLHADRCELHDRELDVYDDDDEPVIIPFHNQYLEY